MNDVISIQEDCSKVASNFPLGGTCSILGYYEDAKRRHTIENIRNSIAILGRDANSKFSTPHTELHIDSSKQLVLYKGPLMSGLDIQNYDLNIDILNGNFDDYTAYIETTDFSLTYNAYYGRIGEEDKNWEIKYLRRIFEIETPLPILASRRWGIQDIFTKIILFDTFAFNPHFRHCN